MSRQTDPDNLAGRGRKHEVIESLEESEARREALLSSLEDIVFELDRDGVYLGVWTASDHLLARPRGELMGRSVREGIGEDLGDELVRIIGRVLDKGSPEVWEYSLHIPTGTRWFQARLAPIKVPRETTATRVCLLVRDVTELKVAEQARLQAEDELRRLALHDALTGLPNRALFADRLEHALARTSRSDWLTAVLFCDLDHFNAVNNTFGHLTGDAVLIEVARRLQSVLRAEDTLSRFGGDEFVCCANVRNQTEALEIAGRISATLAPPVAANGSEVQIRASIGIRLAETSEDGPETLMRDADLAMYQAKASGRDCAVVFDQLGDDKAP
ncbi:MAG TPA: GGDEF domain-containing protein [Acidimicrobiales bacterium]|nr:GGDEF domain-containing protein [Acidimicrobiales bacterium]